MEEICTRLRNEEDEARHAQAFWMQFNHNHVGRLVLVDRVLWAISKAKVNAPFDIGAKRKTKTQGGDDSSDSEDERVKKYKPSFDPSEFGCYVPTDIVMSRPSDLSERMEIFNKWLDLFRSAVHVGRAQFFASYSTRAGWIGLHFPNDICLINTGLIKAQSQALETMAHELAHEHSNKHDIRFVQALGQHTEALYTHLLKRAGSRKLVCSRDAPVSTQPRHTELRTARRRED